MIPGKNNFRRLAAFSGLAFGGMVLAFFGSDSTLVAQESKKIELPEDGNAVVLRLEIQRTARIQPPKSNPLGTQGDSKQGDSKQGDTKSDETKQGDTKSGDTKSGDAKSGDGKSDQSEGSQASNEKSGEKVASNSEQDKDAGTQENAVDANSRFFQPGLNSGNDLTKKVVIVPQNSYVRSSPTKAPLIEIYADGRVKCGQVAQGAIAAESKLTEEQLQQLLNFIINEQKAFELSGDELEQKIKEKNLATQNLAQYTFTIVTRDKQTKFSMPGVMAINRLFPDVKDLQRAYAIANRLNQLFVTINVGGKQNMIAILQSVNSHLKQKNKTAPEFEVGDASFVAVSPNGAMRLTFGKSVFDEKGVRRHRYVATYQFSGNKAKVSIYGY